MEKDIFDYFDMMAEPEPKEVIKEVVFCDEIKPKNETLSFEDGNDFANAIGDDDYYDADGDYSEARGKRRGKKRKGIVKRKPIGKRKIFNKKPIRPVSIKNTRVVELGTQNNLKKQILNALDGEEFFNARGGRGGIRGGGFRHRGRRPIIRGGGGLFWNGAYWVDGAGLCYTKNWLGQYAIVDCGVVPSVAFGL